MRRKKRRRGAVVPPMALVLTGTNTGFVDPMKNIDANKLDCFITLYYIAAFFYPVAATNYIFLYSL